jgi:hypothetical protein
MAANVVGSSVAWEAPLVMELGLLGVGSIGDSTSFD